MSRPDQLRNGADEQRKYALISVMAASVFGATAISNVALMGVADESAVNSLAPVPVWVTLALFAGALFFLLLARRAEQNSKTLRSAADRHEQYAEWDEAEP